MRMERQLDDHRDLLRVTMQAIADAVVVTDSSGRIELLNGTAELMIGWPSEEAAGKSIEEVIELRDRRSETTRVAPVYAAIRDGIKTERTDEFVIVTRDNRRLAIELSTSPIYNTTGTFRGSVLVFHDVSQARQMADRMSYQAHHDALTGLPNRILLVDRLEQGTRMADRNDDRLAVMFVDLDNFKEISEEHGNSIADQLLKEAAIRIRQSLRESDTVCRLGGGEFVVMLPGVKITDDIEAVAAKLVAEISRGYLISKQPFETTCSIGVSIYPQNGNDVGTLMRLADDAMYRSRQQGPNHYLFTTEPAQPAESI